MADDEGAVQESLGPRTAANVNQAPGQFVQGARKVKAQELAGFFQRRGITHMNLLSMHPHVLEHHLRSAGFRGTPSEETLTELRKAMAPGRRIEQQEPEEEEPEEEDDSPSGRWRSTYGQRLKGR